VEDNAKLQQVENVLKKISDWFFLVLGEEFRRLALLLDSLLMKVMKSPLCHCASVNRSQVVKFD
jgi:hypothetical protein